MATSKTLTPTNVTIQIPAFTDKPDQRLNSNCIDKEADAINELSNKLARQQITVTKATGISTHGTYAYKTGKVVCVEGYVLVPAGTYTDSDALVYIDATPNYTVFFFDSKGRIMKITGDSYICFHSSTTLTSNEYIFYNFTYILS